MRLVQGLGFKNALVLNGVCIVNEIHASQGSIMGQVWVIAKYSIIFGL